MTEHELGSQAPSDVVDDSIYELPFDVLGAKRQHTAVQRRALKAESRLLPRGGVAHPKEPNRVRPRLAIYLRISHLKEDSISIARQYRACVDEVRRLGGVFDKHTDLFHDVSVSASKGHYRAGMEDLLALIEDDRAYDGVVIWEFPRALRSYAESLNFRNIFFQGSCELYIVTTPQLRLFGPSAAFFDMHINAAAGESLAMSERARSRHRFMSLLGAARSRPMFGLTTVVSPQLVPGRATPIRTFAPDLEPREELNGRAPADMVREAFDLILEGGSIRSVAHRWNKAGLPSASGGMWCAQTVRYLLINPSIAGLAHRGNVLLGADGEHLAPGTSEAPVRVGEGVVGVEEWLRLRDVLTSRKQVVRKTTEPLLRGLIRCGRCGQLATRRGPIYRCNDERTGYLACGSSNSVRAALIEEFVELAALEVLRSRDRRSEAWTVNRSERSVGAEQLEGQIADLHRRLEDIEGLWLACSARDDHARERHARRRLAAESELAERRSELAALTVRSRGARLDALYRDDRTVQEAFADAAPHVRVSVLHELIERVVLNPVVANGWHEERVDIVWASF